MSFKVSDMTNFRTNFTIPAMAALAALLLTGCAGDNLFAGDDVYVPNKGSEMHPIKLQNGRAVVDQCGDWPTDLGDTYTNELAANHGCAVQNNIAAMAVNPRDVTGGGRRLAPPLGEVQYVAIKKLTGAPSQ